MLAGLTFLACILYIVTSERIAKDAPPPPATASAHVSTDGGDPASLPHSVQDEMPDSNRESAAVDPIRLRSDSTWTGLTTELWDPRPADHDASIGGLVTCPSEFIGSALSVELRRVDSTHRTHIGRVSTKGVAALVDTPVELDADLVQASWSVAGIAPGRYKILLNGSVAQYEDVSAGQNFFFTDLSGRENIRISFSDAMTGEPITPRTVLFLETLGDGISDEFSVGIPASNALVNPGDSIVIARCLTPQITVRASSPNYLSTTETLLVGSNSFHIVEMNPALVVRLEVRDHQGELLKHFPDPFAASGIVLSHMGVTMTPVSQGMDRGGLYAKFLAVDISETLPEIELPTGFNRIPGNGVIVTNDHELRISVRVAP